MNKKAVGSLMVSVLFTMIIVVMFIVIISYTAYFMEDQKNEYYEMEAVQFSIQQNVVTFLNYPQTYMGVELTTKELIIIDYYQYLEKKDKNIFNNLNAKSFFDPLFLGELTYKFSLVELDTDTLTEIYAAQGDEYPLDTVQEQFRTTLPIDYKDIIIKLEVSYDE